jgi:hypothetical protein
MVAAEFDELSPLEHTEPGAGGPRQLVIYANSRHPSASRSREHLGKKPYSSKDMVDGCSVLLADWLVVRLNGKPFKSERWFVEPTGRIAL